MKNILRTVKMKLYTLISLCALSCGQDIRQLQVPLYADPRRAAELSCHFHMHEQKLHSVKWYREMHEIFRYNPSLKPSLRLFNLSDIAVQGGECSADSCMVRVMPPPVATRAAYTCEVSTEGPKFQIARQTKHMTVVAMPDGDPVINRAEKMLKPGDAMFLNCSSDYSLPPAEIHWYLDDELQKPEPWERTETSPPQAGGLRQSWRVLRVRVPPNASGAIRARCDAILLVEPPVVRDVATTITIHSRTMISKYVANNTAPIAKSKTGDISSVANYRPISLATIVAKILEKVIHFYLKSLHIDDGQYRFRPQLSTDMAISMKEIVKYYVKNDTTVYACYLYLSRAFDSLNQNLLWTKMQDTDVPPEVVGLMAYWYDHQVNNVRWDTEMSDDYKLTCGVRQGGLTSPDLFNFYMNDLIEELSSTPVGLRLDGRYVNNLSYADDMVLISPSIKGLRKLIEICEKYALEHNLIYNAKKTEMMIFGSGKGPLSVPDIAIGGQIVKIVTSFKYLGHIISSNISDNEDIERQRRALCVVGNMIARKFHRASMNVKISLFKAYCQSFYTCQLWTNYTISSHNAIRVAYNNVFRHLMGLKWYCSASEMYTNSRVDSFNTIQRKRIASFMSRIDTCKNKIVRSLMDRQLLSATYERWVAIAT